MKHTLFTIVIAAVLFTSCTKTVIEPIQVLSDSTKPVSLTVTPEAPDSTLANKSLLQLSDTSIGVPLNPAYPHFVAYVTLKTVAEDGTITFDLYIEQHQQNIITVITLLFDDSYG